MMRLLLIKSILDDRKSIGLKRCFHIQKAPFVT